MNRVEAGYWLRWALFWERMAYLVLAFAATVSLFGCSTVAVQAPICEPPPVPAALLVPCEEPTLPQDGSFGAVFYNYIDNVVGPWARCIRKDDKLVEIIKYRDTVCEKMKADNPATPAKPWWNP